MRRIAFVLVMTLATCDMVPSETPDSGLEGYDPNLVSLQRMACEKRGGNFAPGGPGGTLVCYIRTRDAGQRCDRAGDCQGLCLARSRTCAPVTPLLGCNEVIDDRGATTNLCID